MNMIATLELFNAVKAKAEKKDYVILPEYGVIVEPDAAYAIDEIREFLKARKITGTELNSTFHKSWSVIRDSSRLELAMHQLMHYLTTYGTNHSSEFVYIPDETLEVPHKIKFVVIQGWTDEELNDAALEMLRSGVALKSDTISNIIEVLVGCSYVWEGDEDVKNKEAFVILCQHFNVYPKNSVELLRYLIYRATGDTMLIKNKSTYRKIEFSNPSSTILDVLIRREEDLATVFNRFKPIFMAFKKIREYIPAINRISKLSKTLHKPMSTNILNNIGSCSFDELIGQRKNLLNANFYQLARCIQFLKQNSASINKVYQVRTGAAYVKVGKKLESTLAYKKISFLLDLLAEKYDLSHLKVHIPDGVFYALPTSEKLFVGNIPFGSKFVSREDVALGVFWRNDGGARDIDISSLSVTGKVGWNSSYNDREVFYSGDITNAVNGAAEYIRTQAAFESDHLVLVNIFSGLDKGSKFNVIVGSGSQKALHLKYMMNPNKVWFSAATESLKKETAIGLITKEGNDTAAIVFNLAFGRTAVSGNSKRVSILRNGLAERWKNCFYVNDLLIHCGAQLVSADEADVDLTPSKLQRDSLISLFYEK
jgi:hypothetical protein